MSNRVTGGHVRVLGGEDGAGGEVEAGAVGVAGGGLLRAAGGHASAESLWDWDKGRRQFYIKMSNFTFHPAALCRAAAELFVS